MLASPPPPPAELVAAIAAFRAAEHGEFELRIGRYSSGRFVAGVPRDVFEQLEHDLLDAPTLQAVDHWSEFADYFYPTASGERARTRIHTDTQRIALAPEHVIKERACSLVLQRPDDRADACRVAVAAERPLAAPPQACIPTHVRIQQRRRFHDVRDGHVVWAYELSKTWSANSRGVVEHMQHLTEPTYEVECELVDAGGRYRAERSDEEIAESVLVKARLLLGEDASAPLDVADAVCEGNGRKRAGGRAGGKRSR